MEEEVFNHLIGTGLLRVGLSFDSQRKELGWGKLALWVDEELLWYQEEAAGDPCPVEWTWTDLLEFLGRNWQWLLFEESYPFHLSPLNPLQLRAKAEERWEAMEDEVVVGEDERLFQFEQRHNLASGLKGIFLPDLMLVREGSFYWLSCEGQSHRIPFQTMVDLLEEWGGKLAEQIQGSSELRDQQALLLWEGRARIDERQFLQLRTGLQETELEELVINQDSNTFWELDAANNDSELMAAARLSGGILGIDAQRKILGMVRTIPRRETLSLDKLAVVAKQVLSTVDEAKPYKQGYQLAQWLREMEQNDGSFDPESLIRRWGVLVQEVVIPNSAIDAVACWGPRHGPVIILNTGVGARPSTCNGRRSTLAHEICHLLVDREDSLPLAEVLGGVTSPWVEKRARAFAAELLLPRKLASTILPKGASTADVDHILEQLPQKFGVSRKLAIHQLVNSNVYACLAPTVASYLQQVGRSAI